MILLSHFCVFIAPPLWAWISKIETVHCTIIYKKVQHNKLQIFNTMDSILSRILLPQIASLETLVDWMVILQWRIVLAELRVELLNRKLDADEQRAIKKRKRYSRKKYNDLDDAQEAFWFVLKHLELRNIFHSSCQSNDYTNKAKTQLIQLNGAFDKEKTTIGYNDIEVNETLINMETKDKLLDEVLEAATGHFDECSIM